MENNPFSSGPYEAPKSGAEKSDKDAKKEKKKGTAAETSESASDKKNRAQRELARSIDKLPLFERTEKPLEKEVADTIAKKAETTAEAERPIDELSIEERQHVQQETARERLAAGEQADAEVAEQRQLADKFLEKVADGQDPEEALTDTVTEAGLSKAEIAELDMAEADAEEAPEAAGQEPTEQQPEDGTINTSDETEGEVNWRGAGSSGDGSGGSGGRGNGGGTPPPPPPTSPAGGAPGAAGPPRGTGVPTPPTPNALPPKVETYYQERNKAGELLLIGLVGYLIGRRRGRIRTEKKLLPVQRKLEKQVKQLQEDITYKERQLVAIKARQQPVESRPIVAPAERTQPGRTETRLGMEKPVRAERLGHMVIAAEAPHKTVERPVAEKTGNIRGSFRAEQVPDMSRNELLELSEKIVVEGATLRSIYESRLIGERQLRHLMSEYLQGKDIRKDLHREMVEREIDFERDPMLRDRVRSRLTDSGGGSGGLGEMLAKAGINTDERDTSFDNRVEKDRAREEARRHKNQRQRLVTDAALATAIVVLAVIVAILALNR